LSEIKNAKENTHRCLAALQAGFKRLDKWKHRRRRNEI